MSSANSTPTFGQQLIRILRFLLRMLFVLVLAIGLGFGIYYAASRGIPELYKRYVQPVEDNTLRLDDLEGRQTQELGLLNERIESLQSRLTDLEIHSDNDKQIIAELEAQLNSTQNIQATQSAVLATLVPQAAGIEALHADLQMLQVALDQFSETVSANSQEIISFSTEAQTTAARLNDLQQEVHILRTMEYLTRARLFLSQGNLGQSEANIQAGRKELGSIISDAPDIEQIIVYLDIALSALPDSPLAAADQLEGAWQILIQDTQKEQLQSTPVPSG